MWNINWELLERAILQYLIKVQVLMFYNVLVRKKSHAQEGMHKKVQALFYSQKIETKKRRWNFLKVTCLCNRMLCNSLVIAKVISKSLSFMSQHDQYQKDSVN